MNPNEPLWMPHGSVRAVVALLVTIIFLYDWAWGDQTVPLELTTLVLGYYFGTRSNATNGSADPPDHPDG